MRTKPCPWFTSPILSEFLTQQDIRVQRSLVGLVEDDAAVLAKQRVPEAFHELHVQTGYVRRGKSKMDQFAINEMASHHLWKVEAQCSNREIRFGRRALPRSPSVMYLMRVAEEDMSSKRME